MMPRPHSPDATMLAQSFARGSSRAQPRADTNEWYKRQPQSPVWVEGWPDCLGFSECSLVRVVNVWQIDSHSTVLLAKLFRVSTSRLGSFSGELNNTRRTNSLVRSIRQTNTQHTRPSTQVVQSVQLLYSSPVQPQNSL